MSYPAACRAYSRAVEDLLKLIEALRQLGVNVDAILNEVKADHHDAVQAIVQGNTVFESLNKAVDNWIGYYKNLKEEEEEWYELNRPDDKVDDDDDGNNQLMYGGVSDDWWDYLDKIGYDKRYDLDD